MVRSGRGPSKTGGRAVSAKHDFFFENLRNPARIRRGGLMRQFRSGQLDCISGFPGLPFTPSAAAAGRVQPPN
jgi:hypothetical protein